MFSKEEKATYFKGLRDRWNAVKKALTQKEIDEISAIILSHGLNFSPISYSIVARQMADQGLDGIPYLDCKTFDGWKQSGFIVKKGEHSTIDGITWLAVEGKETESNGDQASMKKEGFMMPKGYKLFHRSQVMAIEEKGSIQELKTASDYPF